MGRHTAWPWVPKTRKRNGEPRHAKRTTVKRIEDAYLAGGAAWLVQFATLDRPATSLVGDRLVALDIAHRFEQIKAQSRAIEERRLTIRNAPSNLAPHLDRRFVVPDAITVDVTPNLDRMWAAIERSNQRVREARARRAMGIE